MSFSIIFLLFLISRSIPDHFVMVSHRLRDVNNKKDTAVAIWQYNQTCNVWLSILWRSSTNRGTAPPLITSSATPFTITIKEKIVVLFCKNAQNLKHYFPVYFWGIFETFHKESFCFSDIYFITKLD